MEESRIRRRAALLLAASMAAGGLAEAGALEIAACDDAPYPEVIIRSPASGAVVAGMIAVYAEADNASSVAGVQFMADGVNLGAEITSPPYSISWDTAGGDGARILTAAARDMAGRVSYSPSVNITLNNMAVTRRAYTLSRVEETAASVSFSGEWTHGDASYLWSGDIASYARGPAARVSVAFNGTRIRWIGWHARSAGIARVYLDEAQVGEIDLYSGSIALRAPVFTSEVLTQGTHTLTIEATGGRNTAANDSIVLVDAFEIETAELPGTVSRDEEINPGPGRTDEIGKPGGRER